MPGHGEVAAVRAQVTLIRVAVEHQFEFPALDTVRATNRTRPTVAACIWHHRIRFPHADEPCRIDHTLDVHYSAGGAPYVSYAARNPAFTGKYIKVHIRECAKLRQCLGDKEKTLGSESGNVFRRPLLGGTGRHRTRTDWERDAPLPIASIQGKCGIEMSHRSPATGTQFRLRRPRRHSCQEIHDGVF